MEDKRVELLVGEGDDDPLELMANRLVDIVANQKAIVFHENSWRAARWKDIAILIPTRTHLRPLERALADKGIPHTIYGGIGFF